MALKILLADDSMTAQKMGQKILADAGHEVIAVSNGAAAMKKVADNPDIIIVDVYMPGYTGLEICQKVKAETPAKPVLLTVGKMEPFKAEEGAKVKADGVIIKPFEASDLLAAIQKLEKKMKAAAEMPAEADRTMKLMRPAVLEEFKDASYEEWKVDAPAHQDEEAAAPAAKAMEVPAAMAESSAFGDMLGESETPAPMAHTASAAALAPAPAYDETIQVPPPVMKDAAAYEQTVEIPPKNDGEETVALEAPVEAAPETPDIDLTEPAEPLRAEKFAAIAPAPEVEFTAAPKAADVEVTARESALEPTIMERSDAPIAAPGKDPALVTDAAEMANAFPTRFGVEGAEVVPVGLASDLKGLYADENAATEAPLVAEPEVPPVPPEASIEAFAQTVAQMPPAAPEPMEAAHLEVPAAEDVAASPAPEANAPDPGLAAALAAAVGAEVPAALSSAAEQSGTMLHLDQGTVANVVHRIVDRLKQDLVSEITEALQAEHTRQLAEHSEHKKK